MNEVKRCKCGGVIEIESRKVSCFHRTTVICTECHRGITFEARDLKEAILKTIAMWNKTMGGDDWVSNKIKEWTNSFTKECDKFLTNGHEKGLEYGCGTYLWGNENGVERNKNNYISFRVPGATRGGVKVVNDTIIDIVFDEEMCFGGIGCYKKEIEAYIKSKFIGTKFDLPIIDTHY